MRNKVIGIDPSLTGTGIAAITGCDTITVKFDGDELHRLRAIIVAVLDACYSADLVVIEGLSLASRTGKHAERAALHWMLRDQLDRNRIPAAIVPPTCRARYATGKGNAGKDAVMIACVQRLPLMVTNNNEADAAVLLAMGFDHLGEPLAPMPVHHRSALAGCAWPDQLAEAAS